MPTPLIIAHRGSSATHPENTLAAFRAGLAAGADGTELDVYAVDAPGGPYLWVIHDSRLERTTNGSGRLVDNDPQTIATLDAGNGEHVPQLHEVLELLPAGHLLNIEIKGRHSAEPAWRACRTAGRPSTDVLYSSFRHDELRVIRELDRNARLAPLFGRLEADPVPIALALGAWSINLARETVDADILRRAHARGLKVLVYTVNDPAEQLRLAQLGVDGLFCDDPGAARRQLGRSSASS